MAVASRRQFKPRQRRAEFAIEKTIHREACVVAAAGFSPELIGAFGALVLDAEQFNLRGGAGAIVFLSGRGHRAP